MDSRAMVEQGFDQYEELLTDLSRDGSELARVTAEHRAKSARFKSGLRRDEPKTQVTVIEWQCDAEQSINDLLARKLDLENAMFVHKERLYMVKKKLDQGRSWGVDDRTADQISSTWGDMR